MNFLRRIKKVRESYFVILLVILIVIMGNYIASQRFVRTDLTKNQLYALSEASENIMKNLDDIVTVKVFFSEKLPPNLFSVKQYLQDILDELSSYSKNNLKVEFLNPSLPEIKNEAIELGIPQIQMNIVEKDKLEVKNGFLGVAIQYGEKTEILPVVQNILNIEYDLVASIKKVTAKNERVIGFLTGHNEPSLDDSIKVSGESENLSLLKQALDRNYQVKNINLKNDNLDRLNTLLIIGPKTALSSNETKSIQDFIENGGNVVLMADPLEVTGNLQVKQNTFDPNNLIEDYGISINETLVLDRSNEKASFNQGFMSFVLPYPLWVKTIREHFHESNPIVTNLESVIFPWTSSIKVSKGTQAIKLIQTTENAWRNNPAFQLEPNLIQSSQKKEQFTIAALVKPSKSSGHLLAISNARFITDRFIQMYQQNLLFGMNAIDFLTLDNSLISIRSKASFEMPLKELNIRERQWVKLIGTFLVPVLIIVFGVLRYYNRRSLLNNIKWQ